MNRLKSSFMLPFMLLLLVASLHSLVALPVSGNPLWAAPLLACLPMFGLMIWFTRAGQGRSSRHLPWVLVPALVGGAISLLAPWSLTGHAQWLIPLYGGMIGAGGTLLYVFWYSRLPRPVPGRLDPGQPMPDVSLRNLEGETLRTGDLTDRPAIWLFYRGNWCPLCTAQIRELVDRYQALERLGARILLISPQPEEQTRELAQRFEVAFEFLVDPEGSAARELGIYHEAGLPRGMGMERQGYAPDTVLPTAVITAAGGRILWSHQTDNYRVRPEPDTFLQVLAARTEVNTGLPEGSPLSG